MTAFLDELRLAQVNAELSRALAAGDREVLAGRFSPRRPTASADDSPAERAETAVKRSA